jgi:hypothetical protein
MTPCLRSTSLKNAILALMDALNVRHVAAQMRVCDARPHEAVRLFLGSNFERALPLSYGSMPPSIQSLKSWIRSCDQGWSGGIKPLLT